MERNLKLLPAGGPRATTPSARSPELDPRTIARAQRGDEAACRALVERHQEPVFAVIARVLGPRGQLGLVPDLAQETFLRVFRQRPRPPAR
jgi:DNA-directed RNA polymerase specialized sigma24 family protein